MGDVAVTDRVRHAKRYAEIARLLLKHGRPDEEPEDARALAAELDLSLPLALDPDPYPLTAPLGLGGVPVTFLLGPDGALRETLEAFRRTDVERLAALLGVASPLFAAGENVPALRPG
jgi:hypothetical protein